MRVGYKALARMGGDPGWQDKLKHMSPHPSKSHTHPGQPAGLIHARPKYFLSFTSTTSIIHHPPLHCMASFRNSTLHIDLCYQEESWKYFSSRQNFHQRFLTQAFSHFFQRVLQRRPSENRASQRRQKTQLCKYPQTLFFLECASRHRLNTNARLVKGHMLPLAKSERLCN